MTRNTSTGIVVIVIIIIIMTIVILQQHLSLLLSPSGYSSNNRYHHHNNNNNHNNHNHNHNNIVTVVMSFQLLQSLPLTAVLPFIRIQHNRYPSSSSSSSSSPLLLQPQPHHHRQQQQQQQQQRSSHRRRMSHSKLFHTTGSSSSSTRSNSTTSRSIKTKQWWDLNNRRRILQQIFLLPTAVTVSSSSLVITTTMIGSCSASATTTDSMVQSKRIGALPPPLQQQQQQQSSPPIATTTTTNTNTNNNNNYISADLAQVTQIVYFNVRISRSDGTFYIRDDDIIDNDKQSNDDNNNNNNSVYYGQLQLALFGNNAPNHVQRFLQYIAVEEDNIPENSNINNNDESPYPSYSRSSFTRYDAATGLIYGGTIPSLQLIELQQSVALQYGNRLLPAKLWSDGNSNNSNNNNNNNSNNKSTTTIPKKISHTSIGLLTHDQFDVTPVFGITTRNDTTMLNPTHVVFGKLIMTTDAIEFLHRIATIPTYSIDRPIALIPSQLSQQSWNIDNNNNNNNSSIVPPVGITSSSSVSNIKPTTDAIYNVQRELFRNTAKALGDSRLNKVYDGKLLRRVEVTQVGIL